jgi:hypothetical protein
MERFDEYKFFADGTQKLADRRQAATQVYLGVHTAIFALIAFLLKDAGLEGRLLALLTLPLFAVGVFACIVWHKLIDRYKRLITWRYDQLMAMEKTLPDSYQMYSKEQEHFFPGHNGKEMFGFSKLEVRLPEVILALYIIYGGIFVVDKLVAP